MPLNVTSYLEEHGWEGKGVALDGKQGRGLKKPLALPMKRNLRGLGKDRDRATEWWDCLFETSAKSINIQVGQVKSSSATEKALEAAAAALSKSSNKVKDEKASVEKETAKVSLASQAKREYARKMLMSSFVRAGKDSLIKADMDLERILLEQEKKLASDTSKMVDAVHEPSKEERKKLKEEKKNRKEEKRLRKEAKEGEKVKSDKKRKREDGKNDKQGDRKEKKRSKKKGPH